MKYQQLKLAIIDSKMFHFAADTCLLNVKDFLKGNNKFVYKDLKLFLSWLIANRLSLNVSKTEVVLFK